METDPRLIRNWAHIRGVFQQGFFSSFHYAIASVNPDGTPHVTPIGSLILDVQQPKGLYFEIFTTRLRENVERNPQVCVLAVNSGVGFWFSALMRGAFPAAPAVRLYGTVGARRAATLEEINRWKDRVRFLRLLKGYELLWGNLTHVRDIRFERFEAVNMGAMTQAQVWRKTA